MKKNSTLLSATCLALVGLTVFAAACSHEEQLQMTEHLSLKLDPALSLSEKNLLISDVNTLMSYELHTPPNGIFTKIFGGGGTEDVLRYLDDRVNYVIPESVDLTSRIAAPTRRFLTQDQVTPGADGVQQSKAYIMAANIGMALWLNATLQLPQLFDFMVGDTHVPLTSSRNGIIQLGQGYTKRRWLGLGAYMFPSLQRTSTLVHEARHSDCTGGMSRSDLNRIAHNQEPVSRACGHMHIACPAGHPYAGLMACDGHPWGAYAVEAMYELAIVKACTNCTNADKVMATASALDSLSRVTVLDDMMSGRLGAPDMSSSGLQQ